MESNKNAHFAIAIALPSIGLFLLALILFGTGHHAPFTTSHYDFDMSPWTKDSAHIKFTAYFPTQKYYVFSLNDENIREISYQDYTKRFTSENASSTRLAQQDNAIKKCEGIPNNVSLSPNHQHYAVITNVTHPNLPSYEQICIIEVNTMSIVYQSDRTELVQLMRIRIFGIGIPLLLVEFSAVILIILGLGIFYTQMSKWGKVLGTAFVFILFTFCYVCASFGHLFSWFES